ncbi:MAG: DEAD/DEAH box helicase, partial [Anaerolineaceae bacterium]|nr:DEAD/DEAH box helicase [Anaerolineaceae bacterium]
MGKKLFGSYPMRPDDTTWFLVLDFDEEDWQQNVSAFRETCKYYNIIPAVERSRSGNGAHIWFFFEQPVAAKEARRFGSGLLTKTMSNRHELDFASYDRMFPSQDTMPKGGFGNLIALPFQGNAQKNGNSLFIDENFIPYADQWAFLSGLPRITENELIVWNQKLNTQSDLGLLAAADEDAPWESPKPAADLQQEDFPQRLNLVLSNMLYIPKAGLSDKAIDRFKRLAAFRNPIFARNQAMRLPVQNIPRIIDCSELYSNHLGLPRGCMNEVAEILNDHFVPFSIDDKRNTGNPIPVSFIGELRPEQISAAEALLTNEIGVLSATTAFGKTVIAAWLIGQRQVNTLVLVSSSALLTQWKSALEKFLNFDAIPQPEQPKKRGRKKKFSAIGLLGSGKDSLNGIVDIAIIQSLFEGDEKNVKDLVRSYGMVICDECHHVAAFSFEKVMKSVTAKYIYGLSATPKRQDGHDPIIFMQCGPIRYLVDPRSQALKHGFEHFIIPRFTKTRIEDKEAIQSIYSELYQNDARNEMIVRDVLNAYEKGRTPILLTERKEHAELLAAKLVFHAENLFLLIGSDSVKEKREKLEQLHSLSTEDRFIIVATGKYIGEGFDEPRLDTLFLCMPIAW